MYVQIQDFFMLQQVVPVITTALQKINVPSVEWSSVLG
jgi:hypothetical protein